MATQEERKARTRAAVLAAARDRFVAQGYEGTTIRDIAAAAGVGVGTVHVHFTDKPTLLLACFRDQIADAVARGMASLDPEAPLLDQLVHLGGVLYAAYARHPALSRQMLQATMFLDAASDPTSELLTDFLAELVGLYQRALAQGALARLPGGGALAAQGFFSAYLTALIGGLSGRFGPPEAPGAADHWASGLRALLSLQLVGLGADPALLESRGLL